MTFALGRRLSNSIELLDFDRCCRVHSFRNITKDDCWVVVQQPLSRNDILSLMVRKWDQDGLYEQPTADQTLIIGVTTCPVDFFMDARPFCVGGDCLGLT